MIPKSCKRLAEVDFPIAVVSWHSGIVGPVARQGGKQAAKDRRDCFWLYVVTNCKRPDGPKLMTVSDPAQLEWDEIRKIDHYALSLKDLAVVSHKREIRAQLQ